MAPLSGKVSVKTILKLDVTITVILACHIRASQRADSVNWPVIPKWLDGRLLIELSTIWTDLNEFVSVFVEDLGVFLDCPLIARLRCLYQNQQRHVRLKERVTDVVNNSLAQLETIRLEHLKTEHFKFTASLVSCIANRIFFIFFYFFCTFYY